MPTDTLDQRLLALTMTEKRAAMHKPTKRIAITDSPVSFVEKILALTNDRYDFEITKDKNADYVFFSVDGYEVLKYDGVRIFVTGENVTPNFAIADYAMAFEKLSFGDRYIWFPLIRLYHEAYDSLRMPRVPAEDIMSQKTDFCSYVMSNTKNSAEERVRIFDLLSDYKQVNSGGKWRNNVGGPVIDKNAFQARHKFAITFENSSSIGYLTEKFAQAAMVDAIPIYWGDPEVGKIFNTRAFINCHDFPSLGEAVEYVKRVDQDDRLYREILREPWFQSGVEPACLKEDAFSAFLTNIFEQELPSAYRRNRSRWGMKIERRLYDMYHRPHVHGLNLLRKNWREFWHKR